MFFPPFGFDYIMPAVGGSAIWFHLHRGSWFGSGSPTAGSGSGGGSGSGCLSPKKYLFLF